MSKLTQLQMLILDGQFHPDLYCLVAWDCCGRVIRYGDHGTLNWAKEAATGLDSFAIIHESLVVFSK